MIMSEVDDVGCVIAGELVETTDGGEDKDIDVRELDSLALTRLLDGGLDGVPEHECLQHDWLWKYCLQLKH